jgi:hypothetical protein
LSYIWVGIEAFASNDSSYETKQEENQIRIKTHYLF